MISLIKIQSFVFALMLACGLLTSSTNAQTDDKIDFATQVKPILEKHCLHCHGPEKAEDDVRVDDKDSIIDMYVFEGESAEDSHFFDLLVTDKEKKRMPPPDTDKPLTPEQIEIFRKWIDQGAEWPDGLTFVAPISTQAENNTTDSEKTTDDKSVADDGKDPEVKDTKATKEKDAEKKDTEKKNGQKQEDNFGVKLWENIGVTHPAIIHFPIALLLGGALFAVIGFRGDSPMGDAAYYCLWLAALTGIVSCVVGWSYAEFWHKNGANWNDFDFTKTIVLHRWGGILVTVLSLILAIIAYSNRRNDPYSSGGLWKFGMVLLAGLVGYVGHLGGDMTHDGEVEDALKELGIIQEKPVEPTDKTNENAEPTDKPKDDPEFADENKADENSAENDQTAPKEGDGSTSEENKSDDKQSDDDSKQPDDSKSDDSKKDG